MGKGYKSQGLVVYLFKAESIVPYSDPVIGIITGQFFTVFDVFNGFGNLTFEDHRLYLCKQLGVFGFL